MGPFVHVGTNRLPYFNLVVCYIALLFVYYKYVINPLIYFTLRYMTQSNDGEECKASIRNQTDSENSNIEPNISYDEKQFDWDSEVTRYIKNSIARANRNTTGNSLESTVRQITKATSNLANEMPKVAARTIQAANKIVSVGREGVNSINHLRNSVSLNRKE